MSRDTTPLTRFPFQRAFALALLMGSLSATTGAGQDLDSAPTRLDLMLSARPPILVRDPSTGEVSVREQDAVLAKQRLVKTGSPDLARRVVNVLLPPGARLDTVMISQRNLLRRQVGQFMVGPVGIVTGYDLDTGQAIDPLPGLQLDQNGRNPKIYGKNALWPARPVSILETGRLGRYRYVRMLFSPFQWNPATREFHSLDRVHVSITWSKGPISRFGKRVPLMAYGFDDIRHLGAYQLSKQVGKFKQVDYLIITTATIETWSTKLADFEQHKRDLGLKVATVTVQDILPLYPRADPADSIRAFLQDIDGRWEPTYLLLVGDPDPLDATIPGDHVGGVPMKMLWTGGPEVAADAYPTDHYFGELSSDWDIDNDGWAGETVDDGPGIEFGAELLVGRIPFDDFRDVDAALQRTMDYEDASSDPPAYRDEMLLACSFLDADIARGGPTDGAFLGEQIRTDLLAPVSMPAATFYQPASTFVSTRFLEDDVVPYEWRTRRPGLVLWMGHGNAYGTSVGYDSFWDGNLISTSDVPSLPLGGPSFSIQLSCSNAKPEVPGNLAHTLIQQHSVSTIAASRVSYYILGKTAFGDSADIGSIGYWCAERYLARQRAGWALTMARWNLASGKRWRVKNLVTHNLYGDPSLQFLY